MWYVSLTGGHKMKLLIVLVVILSEVTSLNGQLDMVRGVVDMKKVKKFYDILNNSCCSYQPNECMDHVRPKRRTNQYAFFPNDDDDDDDDRIERFEECLCQATKSSQKCTLEFKVNKSKKPIDTKKTYRVVFHWHELFKEFKCRINEDRTIKCQFYRKTYISSKVREDVELLVTYHTVQRSNCRTVCDTLSCAYQAEEQTDFDFYNENTQVHFDMCMNPSITMSTTTTMPTTSAVPVNQPSTTSQSVIPGQQTTTGTNDENGSGKIKGGREDDDVPDISGLVGGIVGGLLVAILIIIAIILYVFRYRGKRTLTRSTSEPIDRKHSVIQETLSDNIYSVMEEPVYQDIPLENDNRSIRDNEPIVRSDSMLDPSYINMPWSPSSTGSLVPTVPTIPGQSSTVTIDTPIYKNQRPPTAPKPILTDASRTRLSQQSLINQSGQRSPVTPTAPTADYHVYEHPVPSEDEDAEYESLQQYEHLGTAPYYIGATEFNPKVPVSKTPIREDCKGYMEPEMSNGVTYNTNHPEYIELELDNGYSLAHDV